MSRRPTFGAYHPGSDRDALPPGLPRDVPMRCPVCDIRSTEWALLPVGVGRQRDVCLACYRVATAGGGAILRALRNLNGGLPW